MKKLTVKDLKKLKAWENCSSEVFERWKTKFFSEFKEYYKRFYKGENLDLFRSEFMGFQNKTVETLLLMHESDKKVLDRVTNREIFFSSIDTRYCNDLDDIKKHSISFSGVNNSQAKLDDIKKQVSLKIADLIKENMSKSLFIANLKINREVQNEN